MLDFKEAVFSEAQQQQQGQQGPLPVASGPGILEEGERGAAPTLSQQGPLRPLYTITQGQSTNVPKSEVFPWAVPQWGLW